MFLVVSPFNPDPLYKQITDQIKEAVASGDVAAGEKLPSIRVMARDLKISEITIKRAYADLEQEGFILTRAGMGSFVAPIDRGNIRQVKLREIKGRILSLCRDAAAHGITVPELIQLLKNLKEPENE